MTKTVFQSEVKRQLDYFTEHFNSVTANLAGAQAFAALAGLAHGCLANIADLIGMDYPTTYEAINSIGDVTDRTFDNDETKFSEHSLVCDHCGELAEPDPYAAPFYRHVLTEQAACGPREARCMAAVGGKTMHERRGSGRDRRGGA